jgi:hypothetical protein
MLQGLLNQARQEEVQAIEDTISGLENSVDTWSSLRKSLLLDSNLSPLSQEDRFLEAQKQFRDVSAKALAGDADAQGMLAGASQSYLEEAKNFYASSTDYYRAFTEVQGVLASAESIAQQQLNAAKAQLDFAKAQLDATIGVKDSIASLQAALVEALAAAAKFAPAMGAAPVGGGGVPATTGGMPGGSYSVSTSSAAYLANNADVAAAIAKGETFGLPAGTSPYAIAAAHFGLFGQNEGRGWSTGGYTGSGGLNDPAGTVHKGEVVWSQLDIARWGGVANVEGMRVSTMPRVPSLASPTSAANSDDASDDLIEELRALRADLRAELRSLRAITAEGAMAVKGSVDAGVVAQQTLAQYTKRG